MDFILRYRNEPTIGSAFSSPLLLCLLVDVLTSALEAPLSSMLTSVLE